MQFHIPAFYLWKNGNIIGSPDSLFNFPFLNKQDELQLLISGVPWDIEDLRRNTVLNGYQANDVTIQLFWEVLKSFTLPQQRKFLCFVTGSETGPLLGFSYLEPKFGIQRSGEDESRLPTAGTCFNLLKLPPYTSFNLLKEKLLYAIESNSGFEMS